MRLSLLFFLCWKFGRKLIIDLSVASSRFPPDPSMNPGNVGDLKNFSETAVWRWVSYHFQKVFLKFSNIVFNYVFLKLCSFFLFEVCR